MTYTRKNHNASKERTTALLADLEAGIDKLVTTDEWKRYLTVAAKFHHYSYGNILLILAQRPDATQVMGYGSKDHSSGWLSVGRHVIKGEHAIWILAPVTRKFEDEETGEISYHVVAWKSVGVFDISQTEGEPLPEPAHLLKGEAPEGLAKKLADAALSFGVKSVEHADTGRANGVTYADGRIQISIGPDPVHQVKTIVHEIAHWLLGHLDPDTKISRPVGELEAESTAYVVTAALGIDSGDYSFGYVTGWARDDADVAREAIRASAARIQKAAARILDALDEDAA